MNTSKVLSITALVLAALAGAGAAQAAHPDVQWSVRIGLPIPLPVLPVLVPRFEPAPVVVQPAWRDRDRDGVPDWRDPYDNRRDWPAWRGWRADRDHDGIPDRYDRHDNRYDRRHEHRGAPPPWTYGVDRGRDGVPDGYGYGYGHGRWR